MVARDRSDCEGPSPNAAASSQETPFLLRLVDIDHVMAKPLPGLDACISPLNGEAVKMVPVIRIYGATPAGQKTLLHLHGVSYPLTVANDTLFASIM